MKTKISALFIIVLASIVYIFSQTDPNSWYPKIDKTAHWSIGSFANSRISNVQKYVKNDATTGRWYSVFYSVSLSYINYSGTKYYITPISETQSEYQNTSSDERSYKDCYGKYSVNNTNWNMYIWYRFFKDGEYQLWARWGESYPTNPKDPYYYTHFDFVFDVDYDLDGASNDIVEYVLKESQPWWNNGVGNVDQWYAPVTNPTIKSYNNSDVSSLNAIEGKAYLRCVDASSPQTQFYLVWGTGATCPVDFYLTTYSGTGNLQDVNPKYTFSFLGCNYECYQQAAYHGRDQKMLVTLKWGETQTVNDWRFIWGKTFKKPNGRSLRLSSYVMNGAQSPNFNLPFPNGRRAINALDELTDSRWTNETVNLPDPYPGQPDITAAQLHALMLYYRDIAYTSARYSCTNFRDWFAEILIVNKFYGTSYGVMFDHSFNPGYSQDIHREGAALFWPKIKALGPNHPLDTNLVLMNGYLHELGHCFNMVHEWKESDLNILGVEYAYNDYGNAGNVTLRWGTTLLNWFKTAPESWVKPGKYGTFWFQCIWSQNNGTFVLNPTYNLYQ